jgi:hypothetical protein
MVRFRSAYFEEKVGADIYWFLGSVMGRWQSVDFTAASSMSHMIRSSGREYRGKCVRA